MDVPSVGSTGRTLTPIAPTGQVEVDGLLFQAETSLFGDDPKRPPIPADRLVVVSAWRADGQHGAILTVSDPTAPASASDAEPAPVPTPPPTPEERIRLLERQLELMRAAPPSAQSSRPAGSTCASCGASATRSCSWCGRFCCESHITWFHPIRWMGVLCRDCAFMGWLWAVFVTFVGGLLFLGFVSRIPGR
jgi:hypothetical protein